MTKKILITILLFLIIISNFYYVQALPGIISETAVLIDAKTGTILSDKDANKKMYPASLTKIMTTILAIEMGKLTDVITVDEDTPYEIEGSHVALEPGEILTLEELLYTLMLPSANDAASVVAKHYGGSLEKFAELMNDKAIEIGAKNTNFVNPHGLHDENHYTTAYDLALITKYAMQNDTFRKIANTIKYEIQPTNKKSETRYFTTLNKLIYNNSANKIYVDGSYISPYYELSNGVKTGYTPEAKNCLVASAYKDGIELIAVTMKGNSLEMYQDAHNLFNYGFAEFENKKLIYKNAFIQNIDTQEGDSKQISAIAENDFSVLVKKDIADKIKSQVFINDISLPLEKNSTVGKIIFIMDDNELGSVNLITPIAVNDASVDSTNNLVNILLKYVSVLLLYFIIPLFVLRIYYKARKNIKRRKKRKIYQER